MPERNRPHWAGRGAMPHRARLRWVCGCSRRWWMYAGSEPGRFDAMEVATRWLYSNVTGTTTEPLTVADRCDRCGAQAYVRVQLTVGELLFCAHHAREHAPKFAELATFVQDETDRLLAEHGAGAGAAR